MVLIMRTNLQLEILLTDTKYFIAKQILRLELFAAIGNYYLTNVVCAIIFKGNTYLTSAEVETS